MHQLGYNNYPDISRLKFGALLPFNVDSLMHKLQFFFASTEFTTSTIETMWRNCSREWYPEAGLRARRQIIFTTQHRQREL